jgi:hypothetical protein
MAGFNRSMTSILPVETRMRTTFELLRADHNAICKLMCVRSTTQRGFWKAGEPSFLSVYTLDAAVECKLGIITSLYLLLGSSVTSSAFPWQVGRSYTLRPVGLVSSIFTLIQGMKHRNHCHWGLKPRYGSFSNTQSYHAQTHARMRRRHSLQWQSIRKKIVGTRAD